MAPRHALPDPSRMQERRLSIGTLNLSVRIWGDPSKPLVLLQHGGKDHGRSWDWTIGALIDQYCLVVPDLRGHGDSDWPSGAGYETFHFVSDMAAIVETLVTEGYEAPIPIIGHSLGGNVALHYAAAQPHRVKSLVVIEGLGFSQKGYDEATAKPVAERWRSAVSRRLAVAAKKPRLFAARSEAIKRMAQLHPNLDPSQAEHLAVHALRETPQGYRWKHDRQLLFSPLRPVPPCEYGPLYGAIDAPVLLMYGADSWASNPADDGRDAFIPQAELTVYDQAGHWLHHDQFERFAQDIQAFLEKTA